MTFETEAGAIIKKIEEQSNVIIEKMTNRQPFEIWIRQQLNTELKRINNESLSNNFKFLAIIIDAIYQFFKNKAEEDKTNFIENFLTNLVNKWSDLSEKEIEEIGYHLKVYINIDDQDAKIASKKFIDKYGESIEQFKISPAKYKKRIKPRIIDFDEDGLGYDISFPYLYFKEVNRLNDIEIEPPMKIKKKLLLEGLLNEELESLYRMESCYEPYLKKIEREIKINEFNLFASKKQKEARLSLIEKKRHYTKKKREQLKNSKLLITKIVTILKKIDIYKNRFHSSSFSTMLPSFESNKNDFLDGFRRAIDYEKFKELICFSEYVLLSIDKMKDSLKKIDIFFKDLGVFSNYENSLEYYYRSMEAIFNRDTISGFLEDSLILFEQSTLVLDNDYCLLNRLDKTKKIVFSEPEFLDKFISANNSKQIYKILSNEIKQLLNKRMSRLISIRNKNYKIKKNLIRKLLSFFDEEYYFTSKKFKRKFITKIFSNGYEPNTVEAMKTILDNLSWRQLCLFHMGIFFLLRKGFRARLSEELFLDFLEEKFKKINENKEPNVTNIDELYLIKNHINSLKSKIQDHSIDLNTLNPLDSRQAVVNRFKNNKEIENLLRNVLILSKQASSCIHEFNNLKDACKRESGKIPEHSQFQLNKSEVSKVYIPLKWTR